MGEIKLFGQKIVLQPKQEPGEDDNKIIERERDDDNDDDDENKTSNHHHKRPEKIIPCPRCKSMETKFCYFNNYNVNQPRHFCKGCQRYWTAGGALRNVPVGAGRRKSKPLGVGVGVGGGGGVEYLENSYFDGLNMSMGNFDLNGVVVDEWRLEAAVAAGGGGFGIKRRKSESTG